MSNNNYLTKTEFAQSLNISLSTLNRYLKANGLSTVRGLLCPKMQTFLREKLDEYRFKKLNPEG